MISDGILLLFEQATHGNLVRAIGFVLQAVDLDGRLGDAVPSFERLHRNDDLHAGRRHEPGQLAGVGSDFVDLIEADDRRGGVDRVHHVVERPGEGVDVFAIERRDEGAVQALDDLVRDEVALVLDFLDLVGLVPDGPLGREHLFEEHRALLRLFGEGDEVVEKSLFARNESERHWALSCMSRVDVDPRRRILADPNHI